MSCVLGPIALAKILESSYVLGTRYQDFVRESIQSSMSDNGGESATLRSIHSSESDEVGNTPKATSKSLSESNSITNVVSTSVDTVAGSGGISKGVSTASLAEKESIVTSRSPNIRTNYVSESLPLSPTINTPLSNFDSSDLLLKSGEPISSALVFANPDDVSYAKSSPSEFSNNSLSQTDKLKRLWLKSGACHSTLTSDLLVNSKFKYLNGSKIPSKVVSYYLSLPGIL